MPDRAYIETGIRYLFEARFRRVEGRNWYLINEHRMVRVCYSKIYNRAGFKRYFFGVQQDKYNQYKAQDIHVLFVCGDFRNALLLPRSFLDCLLEGVPVAEDGNWKFDIHQRDDRFDILVTGREHVDISSYLHQVSDDEYQATSDPILLDQRVNSIRERGKVARPEGSHNPKAESKSRAKVFERQPAVKAWVLQEANGTCELCRQPGPFLLPNGERFLEIHHVKQLAHGGPDIVENAVAVCPNCHRLLHWAADAREANDRLYSQIKRLISV